MFLLFFCGCETWLLTLKKERNKLRLFENRVLRGIFGAKREEVPGGFEKTAQWRALIL